MRPDYVLDIPAAEYHAATYRGEYLSSHMLATFRRCPAEYHKILIGEIVRGETPSMTWGRAVHKFILEPGDFASEYLICDGPTNPKTGEPYGKNTKAYQEWAAAEIREIVSTKDYDQMIKMHDAVWSHPEAAKLLDAGFSEGVVRCEIEGEPVQARMDWYDPERGILADLKTCEDLDNFEREAMYKWHYPAQLAFYVDAIREAGGKCGEAYFIAVEKNPPYRAGVWMIEGIFLMQGVDENRAAIRNLHEHRRLGVWDTKYERMRFMQIPR